jgi:FtsH-binding integral membrane protein
MPPNPKGFPRRAEGFTHLRRSYKRLFSLLAAFVGLIGGCLLLALVLVYPLWHFALVAPEVYSGVVLCALALAAVIWAVRRMRRIPPKTLLKGTITVLALALGLAAFVSLVMTGHKGIALALIPAALVVHGLLNYVKK